MSQSHSWKSIKQAFSSTSPLRKLNRSRRDQLKKSKKRRSLRTLSFIDASDEENVQNNSINLKSTPRTLKTKCSFFNKNLLNSSTRINRNAQSDSDEVIDSDQDPTESNLLSCNNVKRSRNNRQLFIEKPTASESTNKDARETDTDHCSKKIKRHLINIQNTFNGNSTLLEHSLLENSILDSDSDDADISIHTETTPKRIPHNCSVESVNPVIIYSDLSNSNISRNSPLPENIIQSGSSLSLRCNSQNIVRTPTLNRKSPKRKKCLKGGLVELFKQTVNRSKSNVSFWLNERQSELIRPGERISIEKIEHSYGRVLVFCCSRQDNTIKILCIDPESKKLPLMQIGKSMEVEFDVMGYQIDEKTIFYPNISKILI